MKKDEKEVMAIVKETLPLLSKSEKERFLAFAQGMLYIARANENKEASWWKRWGVSNNKIGTVRNNSRNNSFLYKLLQIYVGR